MTSAAPDITIVGLGPGDPARRTFAAQAALDNTVRLFLRTAHHPGISDLAEREGAFILDQHVDDRPDGGKNWLAASKIVCDTAMSVPIVLAIPGHPLLGERLVIETIAEATRRGQSFRVIEGLSVIDLMATALGIDLMIEDVQIIDAAKMVKTIGGGRFSGGVFPFTPLRPMLLSRVYGNPVAAPLSQILQRVLPPDHAVTLVEAAGIEGQQRVSEMTVDELAEAGPGQLASLWVPALDELDAVRDPRTLQHIVARLRRPDGCPWDREQTHESLRDNIIDEAYEVLDAIDAGDAANLAEELGDLFLLICMHAQIAEENGTFILEDVYEGISRKIIRRHPHVFGNAVAKEASDLAEIWAGVKAQEKAENPGTPAKALDGQPRSMPALIRARKVLSKHPLTTDPPLSTADERSRELLNAVAAIVSAGDDPERVLREALAEHVTGNATP